MTEDFDIPQPDDLTDQPVDIPQPDDLTDQPADIPQPDGLTDQTSDIPQPDDLADQPADIPQPDGLADQTSDIPQPDGLADQTSDIPQPDDLTDQLSDIPQPDDLTDQPADILHPADRFMDDPFAQSAAAMAAEQKPRSGWGLRILLTLLVLVIVAFAVFCIVWDAKKGASGGGFYQAGNIVQVQIVQQHKPKLDETLTDANGKYTFEGIAEHVMPSIVEIYTYADGMIAGSGSGIILSAAGYIATNAHVVSGAEAYTVRLYNTPDDDPGYDAVLVGHDTKTDLAVLKISAPGLKAAVLGDSDEMHLGETVCALGNPAGLSCSITTGIISGMNRKVRSQSTNIEMDCFQTDAAISPGNSGGALVNMYGQVIGITSSKYSSSSLFSGGAYEGLGFAITINEALPILTELMEQGYVGGRVRIGIQFLENDDAHEQALKDGVTLPAGLDGYGILIMAIDEDSDLKNTVLQVGDWILMMNGKPVSDYDSVTEAIEGIAAGESVHCRCGRVQQDGSLHSFEIDFRLLADQSGEY